MSGFYLAIEGGEGAGKTTVGKFVSEALTERGEHVIAVREPGSTDLGAEVRRLLLHWDTMTPWAETMLYAAQRAQLVEEIVTPALARGSFVISDRSLYSSLAYQGWARGLGIAPVRTVNELAVGGVLPDLVVVLMVDTGVGLARQSEPDRIGSEASEFHQRVAEGYRNLASAEGDRVKLIEVIDRPDMVAEQILKLIDEARV